MSRKQDHIIDMRPPRPPTGYNLFVKDAYTEIAKQNKGLTSGQKFSLVGEAWKALSPAEQKVYTDKAKEFKYGQVGGGTVNIPFPTDQGKPISDFGVYISYYTKMPFVSLKGLSYKFLASNMDSLAQYVIEMIENYDVENYIFMSTNENQILIYQPGKIFPMPSVSDEPIMTISVSEHKDKIPSYLINKLKEKGYSTQILTR